MFKSLLVLSAIVCLLQVTVASPTPACATGTFTITSNAGTPTHFNTYDTSTGDLVDLDPTYCDWSCDNGECSVLAVRGALTNTDSVHKVAYEITVLSVYGDPMTYPYANTFADKRGNPSTTCADCKDTGSGLTTCTNYDHFFSAGHPDEAHYVIRVGASSTVDLIFGFPGFTDGPGGTKRAGTISVNVTYIGTTTTNNCIIV